MEDERDGISVWIELLWKYKWLIGSFVTLVVLATYFVTKGQPKIYKGSAQVIIELAAPRYMAEGSDVVTLGASSWDTKQFFDTQHRIIRSRAVAKRVVETLGLGSDLDFLGLSEIEDKEELARRLERADPVGILASRVKVVPLDSSMVAYVTVVDRNPKRAAQLANAVAEEYARQNVNRKVSAAKEAAAFIKEQARQVESEREQAAMALLEFKKRNDILNASLGDKQNQLGLNLQDAERQLREARREADSLGAQMGQLKNLSIADTQNSVQEVLSNGLIQRLKEQLVDLRNERSELLSRYLEKHPTVQVANRKIKRVEKALRREVIGIRASIGQAHSRIKNVVRGLEKEIQVLGSRARSLHGMEAEYKRLQEATEQKKTLGRQLLTRLKQAELQAESRANNVRILDEALVPTKPSSPRPMLNLAVALLLGLMGGIVLAFVVDRLDTSVKDQQQMESQFGLTFLGSVPKLRPHRARSKLNTVQNPDRFVIENPRSTAAECLRTVRTNLMFMSTQRALNSIMVTSAGPREGKTTTCVNIGATMAMAGSRTLVVDSDLRRPRIHKVFDLINDRGLTNLVLKPESDIAAVVQPSGLDNLDVLCSGPLPPNPAELLHTRSFRRVVERLCETYDRVIFDSPPVVAVTDAQIVGTIVDGAILVVSAGATSRAMLAQAVRRLQDVKTNLLGGLLNNVVVSRRTYGQYYYRYHSTPESTTTLLEDDVT